MNSLPYYYGFGILESLITIVYVTVIFFGFGILHAYLHYWKKAWLKRTLTNGNYSDEVKESLENEIAPAQPFPLYKYLKFYFSALSVILVIAGLITIATSGNSGSGDPMKIFVFIPAIIGGIFYLIYSNSNKTNGLLRELTAAFMFIGFGLTFVGFFPIYDIRFMRIDILVYIALGFGLFVINYLNAVVTSYLYMIAIALVAAWLPLTTLLGSEWLEFLNLFIWPFGLAILFFWIPRLEEAKKIELREITFGVFFALMMVSLGVFSTYGFSYLAMLVILPALYMFSLKYYKQGNWHIEKPIQSMITLAIIFLSIGLSTKNSGIIFQYSSNVYLNDWGIMKIFSLLIIFGIGFFVIKKYVDEYKDKPNPTHLILLLGLFVFFLATFLGHELRSDMFVFLYAIALGAYYMTKSLKNKDEVVLLFGVTLILGPLNSKIIEFFGTERLDQSSAGAIMVVVGAILAIMVAIMRNQWKVTEKQPDSNSSAAKPEREELDQI